MVFSTSTAPRETAGAASGRVCRGKLGQGCQGALLVGNPWGGLDGEGEEPQPDAKFFPFQQALQRRQRAIGFDVEGDVRGGTEWAADQHSSEAHHVHLTQPDFMQTACRGSPQAGDAVFRINQQ